MDQETEKTIKDQLQILPKEVTTFLADASWGEKVLNIGKKNLLTEDQIRTVQLETSLVLIGLTHPNDFATELESRLPNIGDTKLDNIVSDINREVLAPVRQKLIEFFDAHTDDSSEEYIAARNDPDWLQNVDFILSGGDEFFLNNKTGSSQPEKADKLLGSSNIIETKNKLLE